MSSEKTDHNPEHLHEERLVIHASLDSEITRYRNREWANTNLFTGFLGIIVGLILSKQIEDIDVWVRVCLAVSLITLVLGNIYYSTFAHINLALNRSFIIHLENTYLPGMMVSKTRRHPRFRTHFENGFWDHLLPFFSIAFGIMMFGLVFLKLCWWQYISLIFCGGVMLVLIVHKLIAIYDGCESKTYKG